MLDYGMLDPRSAVDAPKYIEGAHGSPQIVRPPRPKGSETAWCRALMERYDKWRLVVDCEPASRVTLEYGCRFSPTLDEPPRSGGLPRIDAIVWHDAKRCTLVETKLETRPCDVMGGVGQLLYYKAWMERVEGAEVVALVLAAPSLPMLVLEAIQDVRANIRFLKVTDEMVSGLVPRYSDNDHPEEGAYNGG